MKLFTQLLAWALLLGLVILLLYGCVLLFANKYNERLSIGIEKLDQEIRVAEDSIPIVKAKYKELKRIQELSFSYPITPEHVRGEELRALIEGMDSCEIWLMNRRNYIEALTKYKRELHESRFELWD